MMYYDNNARMQQAGEHASRLADDYARANAKSYRDRRHAAAALDPAERARRRAARPQLEA